MSLRSYNSIPRDRRFREGFLRCGIVAFALVSFFFFVPSRVSAQTEEELFNTAANYHRTSDWEHAITSLEGFIQKYPDSKYRSAAELYLGHSYLARNNFVNLQDGVTGRGHLQYIIDKGKDANYYREALLQYCFSYFSLMLYDEAAPPLERFVSEFPDADDLQFALYYLGVTYSNLGKYSQAIETLDRCLNKFPNGQLKNECQLERAIAIGRSGQYEQADAELQRLALNPSYVFRQEASLQRAALKILQEKFNDAAVMLNTLIQEGIPKQSLFVEAHQYLAFCYLELGDYNQALKVLDALQAQGSLSPESAFLKIRVYIKMGDLAQATALLEQVKQLNFSLYGSDAINYYQAMIFLAQGRWDDAINLLVSFLNIGQDPVDPSKVVFNYFNTPTTTQKKLTPIDFLGACGTLVLSYCSRYGAKHFPADNTNQQSVFNGMYAYADKNHDPYLMAIVRKVDRERSQATTNPIGMQQGNSPGSVVSGGLAVGTLNSGSSYPGQPQGQPVQQLPPGQQGQVNTFVQNPQGTGNPNMSQPMVSQTNATGTNGSPQVQPINSAVQGNPQQPAEKKLTPEEANSLYENALRLFENGKYEQADSSLLKLLTSSSTIWTDAPEAAASAALLRANTLFKLNQPEDAQTMCSTLAKMAPSSPQAADANYYLGYWADRHGQIDSAVKHYQKVIESPYESSYRDRAYYALGWDEWERRNTIQAEKYFRKIYRDYTDSDYWGHAAWALAMIEYQDQNFESAERIVNEALSLHPDTAIVDHLLFLKGEIALRFKDYPKARVAFNTITSYYPDSSFERDARSRLENLPK